MSVEDLQHIIPERIKQTSKWLVYGVLTGIIVVMLIVCICLIAALAARHSPPSNTCVSLPCVRASSQILQNLNNAIKPCENFYQYACGAWLNRSRRKTYTSTASVLSDRNYEHIRVVLEKPVRNASIDSAERKLKDFYGECLHDYGRMKDAGRKILDIIQNRLGGWYVINPHNVPTNWDWQSAMTTLQAEYSVHVFVRLALMESRQEMGKSVPVVTIGDLGMYFEVYAGDDYYAEARLAYKAYIKNAVKLVLRDAGVQLSDVINERIEQFVEDVYLFESRQAHVINDNKLNEDWWKFKTTTLSYLQKSFSQINWMILYKLMYDTENISGSTSVQLVHEVYFRTLNKIIKTQNNKARVMNSVLVWSLIDTYARDLSWDYRVEKHELIEKVSGHKTVMSTWQSCIDTATIYLTPILITELLQDEHGEESHSRALAFMRSVRDSLSERLDHHVTWMDDVTKQRANDKLNATSLIASFPHNFIGRTKLDKLYSQMHINKTDGYLENLMSVYRQYKRLGHQALHTVHMDYVWINYKHREVFGVIPQFDAFNNELFVPVGALQFPQYSWVLPDFMNYAGVGVAIGRKLVKAVNLLGSHVLKNGTSGEWWSVDTKRMYTKDVNTCLATYYDTLKAGPFLIGGMKQTVPVIGNAQVPKAVDWIAGIHAAFHAFTKRRSDDQLKTKLAGMDITERQAFFVAHIQSACESRHDMRAFALAKMKKIPREILLNGVLRHVKAFRDTFQCSASSNMGIGTYCDIF